MMRCERSKQIESKSAITLLTPIEQFIHRIFIRKVVTRATAMSLTCSLILIGQAPARSQTVSLQTRRDFAPSLDEQLNISLNNGTRGTERDRADQLMDQGNRFEQQGDYAQAIATWNLAQEIYRRLGDFEAQGFALDLIGLTYGNMGDYVRAEAILRERLKVARNRQDFKGQVFALNNLGTVLLQVGYLETANTLFQEASTIAQDIGYAEGVGLALSNLGLITAGTGDYTTALERYEEAWLYRRRGDNQLGQANTLNNLGDTYVALNQYSKAIGVYGRAEYLARLGQDYPTQFRSIDGLVAAYQARGLENEALNWLVTRLNLAQEQPHLYQEFVTIRSLAQFYHNYGHFETARGLYEDAIVLAELLEEPKQVALLEAELTRLEFGFPSATATALQTSETNVTVREPDAQ